MLNALEKIQSTLDEKRELYTFQLEELDKYELEENVDSRLSTEHETLTRASEIIQTLDEINIALDDLNNSNVFRPLIVIDETLK